MSRFLEEFEDLPLIDPITVAADQVVEALLLTMVLSES